MNWEMHFNKMMLNFTSREFQGFLIVSIILLISGFRMLFSDTLYGFEAFKFIADIWLWSFGIYAGVRTFQKLKVKDSLGEK